MQKKSMQAARLHRIGDFRTDEVPVPVAHGQELLVKIGACGVCGSDLPRIYCHGTSSHIYPLTLGHEFSGTIVSVGEKADPALIGRKGCFYPLIPCRTCDSCLTGNYAMCEHYDYMGSRCDGGFAEYCLVPGAWHFIESHNPNITFEELAMVEPACVAQHAIRKGEVFAGANVVIFGAGPIGIMAGRWARLSGANVLLVDVLDQKVAFARECGFAAVNSTDADFLKKVQQAFGGHPADIAIEGSGFGSALENAIHCIRAFGRIVLLGNPAGDTQISQASHSLLLRKEATVTGTWNSHFGNYPINEWHYTVEMMDAGKFTCSDLISHRVPLKDLPSLVDNIKNHSVSVCKAMYVSALDN